MKIACLAIYIRVKTADEDYGYGMIFEDLMKNDAFLAKLAEAQDMSEVKALFVAEGITVSDELLMKYVFPENDELYEDTLDYVAGGSVVINPFWNWLRGKNRSHS